MLVPGAFLLFFHQDGSNQVVNVYPGDGAEQGLRGDERYNPRYAYTAFIVPRLDAEGRFYLEFHQGSSIQYVKYDGVDHDLIGTPDQSEATLFAARPGRDASGAYHRLTFEIGTDKMVVSNVSNEGVRSERDTGSNGTRFEFIQVPENGNFAIVKVEIDHLDNPSIGRAEVRLAANPEKWLDTSSSPHREIDWINNEDIYTAQGKQCVMIMELVPSPAATAPEFYNIRIGPEQGPLRSPNPTVIPGTPFAVTRYSPSTRLILTETSLESGKRWRYQLSVVVGDMIYTCDPKIYNDGTNPPPPPTGDAIDRYKLGGFGFLAASSVFKKLRSALSG